MNHLNIKMELGLSTNSKCTTIRLLLLGIDCWENSKVGGQISNAKLKI